MFVGNLSYGELRTPLPSSLAAPPSPPPPRSPLHVPPHVSSHVHAPSHALSRVSAPLCVFTGLCTLPSRAPTLTLTCSSLRLPSSPHSAHLPTSPTQLMTAFHLTRHACPADTTWKELKDHMRSAGTVLHADVITGEDGRSRGYGLVSYATEEEAQEAIESMTDTELDGRSILVRQDKARAQGLCPQCAVCCVHWRERKCRSTGREARGKVLARAGAKVRAHSTCKPQLHFRNTTSQVKHCHCTRR